MKTLGLTLLNAINALGVVVNEGVDPFNAMGKLLDTVIKIVSYVGGAVAVFGFFELGLALFAEGQADKKPRAFMCIGAGAIMIGARILLTQLGIIS